MRARWRAWPVIRPTTLSRLAQPPVPPNPVRTSPPSSTDPQPPGPAPFPTPSPWAWSVRWRRSTPEWCWTGLAPARVLRQTFAPTQNWLSLTAPASVRPLPVQLMRSQLLLLPSRASSNLTSPPGDGNPTPTLTGMPPQFRRSSLLSSRSQSRVRLVQ